VTNTLAQLRSPQPAIRLPQAKRAGPLQRRPSRLRSRQTPFKRPPDEKTNLAADTMQTLTLSLLSAKLTFAPSVGSGWRDTPLAGSPASNGLLVSQEDPPQLMAAPRCFPALVGVQLWTWPGLSSRQVRWVCLKMGRVCGWFVQNTQVNTMEWRERKAAQQGETGERRASAQPPQQQQQQRSLSPPPRALLAPRTRTRRPLAVRAIDLMRATRAI